MLSGAASDPSAWQNAASFAVIFAQRRVDGEWERRIEAEQTEMEPALEPRQWPGWECGALCDWMLGQLGLPEDEEGCRRGARGQRRACHRGQRRACARGQRRACTARRAELRIDSATITDAVHELDLITAGHPSAAPPDGSRRVRLRFTVSGGRSGQQLRAAA